MFQFTVLSVSVFTALTANAPSQWCSFAFLHLALTSDAFLYFFFSLFILGDILNVAHTH